MKLIYLSVIISFVAQSIVAQPGQDLNFNELKKQAELSLGKAVDFMQTLAIEKALDMMVESQLENGGWPHKYPWQGNYHDYATFNDQGINDCIRVMIEANSYYDRNDIKKSLDKVGRFMMISQLPPPQPGWAQQYNEYLQPAWARTFEPPAVCPSASLHNIHSLIDFYELTGEGKYLEPIPDALRWIKSSQLPNGKWGRFLEIGTNKPLYYDRGRIRVDSLHQLSLERRTGYGYENDLSDALRKAEFRYLVAIGEKEKPQQPAPEIKLKEMAKSTKAVVESQDEAGRWIVHNDKFRKGTPGYKWKGEYRFEDRISSALFNRNVAVLCKFLEHYKQYAE